MNQLVFEQKALSTSNPITGKILINKQEKILKKELTWQDIRGLSWIFEKEDE